MQIFINLQHAVRFSTVLSLNMKPSASYFCMKLFCKKLKQNKTNEQISQDLYGQ